MYRPSGMASKMEIKKTTMTPYNSVFMVRNVNQSVREGSRCMVIPFCGLDFLKFLRLQQHIHEVGEDEEAEYQKGVHGSKCVLAPPEKPAVRFFQRSRWI